MSRCFSVCHTAGGGKCDAFRSLKVIWKVFAPGIIMSLVAIFVIFSDDKWLFRNYLIIKMLLLYRLSDHFIVEYHYCLPKQSGRYIVFGLFVCKRILFHDVCCMCCDNILQFDF